MIEQLRAEKAALLVQAEQLAKRKQELYGDIDISQPMSEDEKQLNSQIASIFSQINEIVSKIRFLKQHPVLFGGTGKNHSKI